MGVAHETDRLGKQAEDLVHAVAVPPQVLAHRIRGQAVNHSAIVGNQGLVSGDQPLVGVLGDRLASPAQGVGRWLVEAAQIVDVDQPLLVVAHDALDPALAQQVHALLGLWPISHHVAEAKGLKRAETVEVPEDFPEGFEIAVDVGHDGNAWHKGRLSVRSALCKAAASGGMAWG